MAGRPVRKAQSRINRSLGELVDLLVPKGIPVLPADVHNALAQGAISRDEAIVLGRHAQRSPKAQRRALRSSQTVDLDALRARLEQSRARWQATRTKQEGGQDGS